MTINNITIKNFRGFQEKYFEFDPHVNVVLGDNTTGKTTLLHAIQIALGAYFKALKKLPRTGVFSRGYKQSDIPMYWSEGNRSFVKTDSKPCIITNATFYKLSYNYNNNKVSDNGIGVKGIDNCLVKLSQCCHPVPGDEGIEMPSLIAKFE